MRTKCHWLGAMAALVLGLMPVQSVRAATEALDWNVEDQKDVTCIFGEITVLASVKNIYFCGCQWDGVGGYCGIQDLESDRRTIFSIWDTSPKLHPRVTAADPQTVFNRFGGEGEGAHTHMLYDWKFGQMFRFFLHKSPAAKPRATDTRFYVFDAAGKKWRQIATIESPNGPKNQGTAFEGICSWIENIGGQADVAVPKVALYNLWIGSNLEHMKRLTHTGGESGSGRWGQWHGQYFLAEGSKEQLADCFAAQMHKYGQPLFGKDGHELPPLPDEPLAPGVLEELLNLPPAPPTTDKPRK